MRPLLLANLTQHLHLYPEGELCYTDVFNATTKRP